MDNTCTESGKRKGINPSNGADALSPKWGSGAGGKSGGNRSAEDDADEGHAMRTLLVFLLQRCPRSRHLFSRPSSHRSLLVSLSWPALWTKSWLDSRGPNVSLLLTWDIASGRREMRWEGVHTYWLAGPFQSTYSGLSFSPMSKREQDLETPRICSCLQPTA